MGKRDNKMRTTPLVLLLFASATVDAEFVDGSGNISATADSLGYIVASGTNFKLYCGYMPVGCGFGIIGDTQLQQFRLSNGQFHAYDMIGNEMGCIENVGGVNTQLFLGSCGSGNSGGFQYVNGFILQAGFCLRLGKLYPITSYGCEVVIQNCAPGPAQPYLFYPVSPTPPECTNPRQFISDLKCKNPATQGTCSADWAPGSVQGAHSEQTCDACHAPEKSETQCDFNMALATTQTITNTWEKSIGIGIGLEFTIGFNFIAKSEFTAKFHLDAMLKTGKSMQMSTTTTLGHACHISLVAGTAADATADVITGTLAADFTATLSQVYDNCPETKKEVETQITITNVPTLGIDGSCKVVAKTCNKTLADIFV